MCILTAEKVVVVRDTGETGIFSWSFNQKDLLFYEPSKSSDSSEFTVGSLIREGNWLNKCVEKLIIPIKELFNTRYFCFGVIQDVYNVIKHFRWTSHLWRPRSGN